MRPAAPWHLCTMSAGRSQDPRPGWKKGRIVSLGQHPVAPRATIRLGGAVMSEELDLRVRGILRLAPTLGGNMNWLGHAASASDPAIIPRTGITVPRLAGR